MNKTEKRKLMKAQAVMCEVMAHQKRRLRAYQISRWSVMHIPYESPKAKAIHMTPSKLFRTDKPELDKRRYKRFNKMHKNSYLVSAACLSTID